MEKIIWKQEKEIIKVDNVYTEAISKLNQFDLISFDDKNILISAYIELFDKVSDNALYLLKAKNLFKIRAIKDQLWAKKLVVPNWISSEKVENIENANASIWSIKTTKEFIDENIKSLVAMIQEINDNNEKYKTSSKEKIAKVLEA